MNTLVTSFLDGSSSFLQVTRPTIKAPMSLNFVKIPSPTLKDFKNAKIEIHKINNFLIHQFY